MSYNGHASRAQWNVALWIANDEGLYRLALECIRSEKTRDDAARRMLVILHDAGETKTPDGYAYTFTAIRNAMKGL